MKKTVIVQALSVLTAVFLWNSNMTEAKAESKSTQDTVSGEMNVSKNNIGGMSELLDNYYDGILSKKGISVNNVATTIYVDGERLVAKDNTSILFQGLGLANVNDFVNIRAKATTDSQVVGKLFRAGVVKIEAINGNWAKVTSDKVSGYIKRDYLLTDQKAVDFAQKYYNKYARVTCNNLNIRSGPGVNYRIIAKAVKNEEMQITDIVGDWVQIKYGPNSQKAYCSKNYVDYVYDFNYAVTIDEAQTNINCMIWPLPSDHNIYTYYGYRKAPIKGASTYHLGLDIGGEKGAGVVAVLAGKVITTSYNGTSGYYVEIDHGNNVITRYLHNSKILVHEGQHVNQGDVISLVGSTGVSTAPHLHFSLVVNGKNIDPYPYLKKVQ
ncbi:MAG: peptidoglycan DD-metalloendopeptidase family protein [Clostridiales bacterium]|nr:peptidoglycan DD-metalloendopeptidase family protein [Clostridiales bacterium]